MNEQIKQRINQLNNGEVPTGYKKTEFGVFPCDWSPKTIGEVSTEKGCYGLNAPACDYEEGLPKYLRITDIDENGNYLNNDAYVNHKDSKNYMLQENDIVFARTGASVGKNYLYASKDGELSYAGFLIKFSIDETKCVPYMVKANCRGNRYDKWVQIMSARSGQPGINAEEYADFALMIPNDLKEQSKIAEILMKWDEAIKLQEKLINILEKKKEYIKKKLLTPQKDWFSKKLFEIVTKEKGKAVKTCEKGATPVIDMEYLENGSFSNYTDEDGILSPKESILLLWDGASSGTLLIDVQGMVGSTFALLSIHNKEVHYKYLYYWLDVQNRRNRGLREGSGIPHMPKDYLSMQDVCFPDIAKQIEISETLSAIEKIIKLQKEKMNSLEKQRKTLQQYLLNGIVRV